LILYLSRSTFLLTGDNVHFKILIPGFAAGAIIGKGGETIAQIQKDTGARIKMSKASDFYPGKFALKAFNAGRGQEISYVYVAVVQIGLSSPERVLVVFMSRRNILF
jgi:hypothetical protein